MCGICGIYQRTGGSLSVDHDLMKQMTAVIRHRGPDDGGYYWGDNVHLGMRRLSIIDLAGGRQPIYNEDGSIVIVFNGEIYNFTALRRRLSRQGHRFQTDADTEVIIHLYEESGPGCTRELNGMFAFALWDGNRRRLLIARDRVGIKPLYYTESGGRLIFASEIKSILQCRDVPRSVNLSSLNTYLSIQYVPGPGTMFQGIQKLPPGHSLLASTEGGVRIEPYWRWPEPDATRSRSRSDLAAEILTLLRESVASRLVSDVPLGAFLSGGIDSSTIVALMSSAMNQPVKTFSVGFTAEAGYDETQYARQVSREFGTKHHELTVDARVIGLLPRLVWHLDEPVADRAALPTFLVSQLARRYVTVALSGEGGDELFAGYRRYLAADLSRTYRAMPARARRTLGWLMGRLGDGRALSAKYRRFASPDLFDLYSGQQSNFSPQAKQALLSSDLRTEVDVDAPFTDWGELPDEDWLTALLRRDATTWLPDDLLMKVDKMSMATSLEARVPFLDHRLIEYAAAIPAARHLRRLTTKHLLKQAVRDLIPRHIINRRKQGFDVPLTLWLKQYRDLVHSLLLSRTASARGYFNQPAVERLVARLFSEQVTSPAVGGQVWNLLCLELWHRIHLDGDRSWLDLEDTDEYLDRQQVLLC